MLSGGPADAAGQSLLQAAQVWPSGVALARVEQRWRSEQQTLQLKTRVAQLEEQLKLHRAM
jgi:hypothetical protein